MALGDLLDGAFKLLKANWRTIVLVTAVFEVPLSILGAWLQRDAFGGQSLFSMFSNPELAQVNSAEQFSTTSISLSLATSLLGLLVTALLAGAISRVVASSYLGEELSVGDALRATGRRLAPLLAASLMVTLLIAVGALLCLVGAVVPATFFVATTAIIMVEGLGPIAAMGRSATLIRPRFWPYAGIVVLSYVIAQFLGSILGAGFVLLGFAASSTLRVVLLFIGSLVAALITRPFVTIVATLVYYDARIRHEGFDLQVIAADLARSDAPPR